MRDREGLSVGSWEAAGLRDREGLRVASRGELEGRGLRVGTREGATVARALGLALDLALELGLGARVASATAEQFTEFSWLQVRQLLALSAVEVAFSQHHHPGLPMSVPPQLSKLQPTQAGWLWQHNSAHSR